MYCDICFLNISVGYFNRMLLFGTIKNVIVVAVVASDVRVFLAVHKL